MKVFYKDVVASDFENFFKDHTCTKLPIREYAKAKGFDYDLFNEFFSKIQDYRYNSSNQINESNVSVNEIKSTTPKDQLCGKRPWPQITWDRNETFFSLTDEEVTKYNTFIEYYTNLNHWFEFMTDSYGSIANSTETFEIYRNYCAKHIPEDKYKEVRFINFPYLMEMSQGVNRSSEMRYVNVPARYLEEWGLEDRPVVQKIFTEWQINFWRLIPTSKETPYQDEPNIETYFVETTYNDMPSSIEQREAIAHSDFATWSQRIYK